MVDFAIPADTRVKIKASGKRNKYLDFARVLKKNKKRWNMKMTVITIVIGALGTIPRGWKSNWRLGNKRASGDHPDYSIIQISQNTEKSPVTQTPLKSHQLKQVWKTFKGAK